MPTDIQWNDARRIEAWAGEVRVNLIRLVAILGFYGHHLVNVYFFRDDPSVVGPFHTAVTALMIAWAGEVLALHFCLTRRWLPPALPYAAVAWDILLITALLMLTTVPAGGDLGDLKSADAKSWLAALYLLVIATAPLRLSLPLVYTATLGSMAAYLYFLGYVKYWLHLDDTQRLSRPNQVIFLLSLGAAGLLAGQMVRQARRLVHGYPVTVAEPEAATAEAQAK
jgi:hypothetical protein